MRLGFPPARERAVGDIVKLIEPPPSRQVFTQAFVLTNGGPNNATLTMVLYVYRKAFQEFAMGYASAVAWVLFMVILLFTLLVFRSSSAWVYYEGGLRSSGPRP